MHLSEFKAWFEGFTDSIDGIPSPKQWNKIKERVSQITNDYTPAPVFVDHYVRPYWLYYSQPYYGLSGTTPLNMSNAVSNNLAVGASLDNYQPSQADWRALGAAELKSIQ